MERRRAARPRVPDGGGGGVVPGGGGGLDEVLLLEKMRRVDASSNAIQTLSHWCVFYERHAGVIVSAWRRELERCAENGPKQLALLYLANDILQNCRNKGKTAFINSFWAVMPRSLGNVLARADEKLRGGKEDGAVRARVERLVKIWIERRVFGATTQADELRRCIGALSTSGDAATATKGAVVDKVEEKEGDGDDGGGDDDGGDDGDDDTEMDKTEAPGSELAGAAPDAEATAIVAVTAAVAAVENARQKRAREAESAGVGASVTPVVLAATSPEYKACVDSEVKARRALVAELEKQIEEQRDALSALGEREHETAKRRRTDGDITHRTDDIDADA